MSPTHAERVTFFGYPVDRLDMSAAVQWIRESVAERTPRQIAVINANKLYLARRNPRLAEVMRAADLVIPEWAVVWAAAKLRMPALHHVGGITLAEALLPVAAEEGMRIFLLGATADVVARLAERLRRDFPKLAIAGVHDGYWKDDAEMIDAIRAAKPDVLFVAVGSPKQELWIDANKNALGVPVSIGLGGTFDVLSGMKKDTPAWARGRGLEWLYRLLHDPRAYARRYFVTNSWFVWQVVRARLGARSHAAH